ncbi:MAG: acetate--CoA ligase family protein [Chloroflexota bacterium]|nr:acetate--CoA ligase family protein [Chloroflexota bacterium]
MDETAAVARSAAPSLLDPVAADALLRRYGIPTPAQSVAAAPEEAVTVAGRLGFPVALKAVGPGIIHKSDAGGVRLGLASPEEVAAAAREMTGALPELSGFLVQQMAPPGHELIVGLKRDPHFGPVVMVGQGGVLAEILNDVALRLAPVEPDEAMAMLAELRGARLLTGYRGAPPLDLDAVGDLIARVSRLAEQEPTILELDLNPVIVRTKGLAAVDARILVAGEAPRPEPTPRPAGDAVSTVGRMLNPRSVVVVGASETPGSQGGRLFRYLIKHGFPGSLYAVNPRASAVMGRPCYSSVADLPETPDLACIMVPSDAVLDVVAECGAKGIAAAVVYTAGFAETGDAGRRKQAALVETARRYGMRLCGPNTAGLVNAGAATCAAFGMAFEVDRMPTGSIAFLTQSGALGSSLLSRSWAQGIGFSHWICAGNEADLTLGDYLAYLVDDPATRVVAIFMESVRDPAAFLAACRRARAAGKPIVVYKTGASAVGQRAVRSHTAALAGDDRVYDAAFRQSGVVCVHDLQALIDAALALAWQPLPRGNRIAVISASGGACSVIADECARYGLDLPLLPEPTVERIAEIIPPFGVAQNPIDVTMQITANPGMIGQAAELILREEGVDALIVMLTTNAGAAALEVAKGVVRAARSSDKPVLVARVGAEFLAPESVAYYQEQQIPLFPMPDRVVKVLNALVDAGRFQGRQ